ncbi:MAG: FHA domain-containing protein [Chloroflexota bacterium]|nr:FHA domain-containing protein [Chloroflexota bacterium]
MAQQRPIGVTILAIWFFLNGISTFLSGLGTMFIPLPSVLATFTLGFGIFGVLLGAVFFAVGWGLWSGMNWARITTIVLSVIGLLGYLVLGVVLIAGFISYGGIPLSFPGVGAGLIILALIQGLIIYYLLRSEVDVFFTGGGYAMAAYAEATVTAQPPTPVVTTPAPMPTAPQPSPRLPGTEVIGAPQPPAAWLVARTGPRPGKEYGLQRGRNTVGRDGTQCDIVLDDSAVSKLHAEVRYENGQFILYDHASTNGTFVNNRRVQRQSLLDGDDVRIGNSTFVFKEVKLRPAR